MLLPVLRAFVRDVYGEVCLVVFDIVVRESVHGGVLETIVALYAHIPVRHVRASCCALQKGGFVAQNASHNWFFEEKAAVERVKTKCITLDAEMAESVQDDSGLRYVCKHCGLTRRVEDVMQELWKESLSCCDTDMMEYIPKTDSFASIIAKLS